MYAFLVGVPYSLRVQLALGRVVPFVGAGVSMALRDRDGSPLFPSWRALLLGAADLLEREARPDDAAKVRLALDASTPDYLEAASCARSALRSEWTAFLQRTFRRTCTDDVDAQLAVARMLWSLRSSLVVTTNYDNVLTWSSPDPRNTARWIIESPAAMVEPQAQLAQPTIWHLHGHIDHPTDLILTPDGYSRLYADDDDGRTRYAAARRGLQTLMAASTFLFVGFSLSDPYFVRELDLVHEIFAGASRTHYAIIRQADEENFVKRMGSLPVVPLVVADHGPPVLELLQQLAEIAADLVGISGSWDLHRGGATLTIKFFGSLDINSVPAFAEVIEKELTEDLQYVEIDLHGLDLIDSSGIAGLTKLYKVARSLGCNVRVTNARDQPLAIMKLLRLDVAFALSDRGQT